MGNKGSRPSANPPGPITYLANDVLNIVGPYLTQEDMAHLSSTNRNFYRFFTKLKHRAQTAAYLLLTGRAMPLLHLLEKNPQLFFIPSPEVKDASGQIFHNVSPADLLYFLCDDDMRDRIQEFAQHLPQEQQDAFFSLWKTHQASHGKGGADLVYVRGGHPPLYANIRGKIQTFDIFEGSAQIRRTLLKNPDGLVCWQHPNQSLTWFYANPKTQALEPVELQANLPEPYQTQYNQLRTRMVQMEPSTARRSSNTEHQLFQAIMRHQSTQEPISLVRQGIHYRQDGIEYIDTHHDFNRLINAYLKCIRLYQINYLDEADKAWREQLGHEQKKVMWLVQTYCEPGLLFYPLRGKFKTKPLQRSFMMYYFVNSEEEPVFDVKSGRFASGFGMDDAHKGFALYKAACERASGTPSDLEINELSSRFADLIAIHRRCTEAILNIEAPIVQPKPNAQIKPPSK